MKRVLFAVVVAVFLLGACGDDGGSSLGDGGDLSGDEQAAADNVAASLKDDPDAPPVTDEEASCVGAGIVGVLGVDRVNEIDFDDDNITLEPDEAAKVADAFVSCVDVRAFRAFFVEAFTQGAAISAESASCLADEITDDDVQSFLTSAFAGYAEPPADFIQRMTGAMSDCLTDEEFAEITA